MTLNQRVPTSSAGGMVQWSKPLLGRHPADARLVGKSLPQVPHHRGSVQVSYSHPRFVTAAIQVQLVGAQFDDDLNQFELVNYTLADITAIRTIRRGVELFFGVQNLFDTVYAVGTNPTTIGAPRLVNGGVRVRFGG